jgi:hypothetical protein
VLQTLSTKVVKQVALFNNAKGSVGFYSLVWAGTTVQNSQKLGACEQWFSACFCIFHTLSLKISNANLHESFLPCKTANFEVFSEILENVPKFYNGTRGSKGALGF